MTREQMLRERCRKQAEVLRRHLEKKHHRKVRDCLQWWADNTPEQPHGPMEAEGVVVMEPKQVNEAQAQYEREVLGEGQPATTPTDYELVGAIEPDEWIRDFGDMIMGQNCGQLLTLLTCIRCATKAADDDDADMLEVYDRLLGQRVRDHVTTYLRTRAEQ